MSSKITGKEYPLSKVFGVDFEYHIPGYQRPYAWTEEEMCDIMTPTNRNFTELTEMNLELILMSENDIAEFKKNVQCAFQKGFEDVFGKCEETILPEKDIDQSLNGKGSVAYKAVLDGETVGGVIVAIDTETQHPLLCEYLWISHHRVFQ